MPREPKPYYRKAQKRWVCTINGQRVTLGEFKEEAFRKFHELMLDKGNVRASVETLYELTQLYLDWVEKHRSPATYARHAYHLKTFIAHIGRTLKISALKNYHLHKWVDSHNWNSTNKNDAISIVLRCLNWSVSQGYIQRSPIVKIDKPKRLRRDIFYTPEQWKQIKDCSTDEAFTNLLDFLWATGCRPKEVRDLESRHVDLVNEVIVFPAAEAKGGIPRVIYLTPEAKEILLRVWKEGKLFLNSQGKPWTKDAIKNRLTRVTKKVGFRVIAYGARHSYCTRALKNGVDTTVVATLMGHRDATMVAQVYAHIAQDVAFLKRQAFNATAKPKLPEEKRSS